MNLHVPVVDALQQITNELFVFPAHLQKNIVSVASVTLCNADCEVT